jgi:hypothetical protein
VTWALWRVLWIDATGVNAPARALATVIPLSETSLLLLEFSLRILLRILSPSPILQESV